MNLIRIQIIVSFFVALSCSSDLSAFTLISNGGKPAYWNSGVARYKMHSTTSGYFTGGHDASGTVSTDFDPIRAGFDAWTTIPGLDLTVQDDGLALGTAPASGDGQNSIGWVRSSWRSLSFHPPSNALAVTLLSFDQSTGKIAEADIFFNAESFRWAVVDSPSESSYIDVQNIATHEIGHFLGVDHSSEDIFETDPVLADATMFYAAAAGETSRRDPHEDDVFAITSLYSSSDLGTPSISSAELLSNSGGVVTFRIQGDHFNEYTSFVLSKLSNSETDVVARYRTVSSSSEAVAQFDSLGFSGSATLLAFNNASRLASFRVDLTALGLQATEASDGGGGGCEINLTSGSDSMMSIVTLVFGLMLLFSLRFSLRAVTLKTCSTRRGKNKF